MLYMDIRSHVLNAVFRRLMEPLGVPGDSPGDHVQEATPPSLGKFWSPCSAALGEDDQRPLPSSPSSEDYRTSGPERAPVLSSRYEKRLRNRILQREDALALVLSSDRVRPCSSAPASHMRRPFSPPVNKFILPVLEPIVFLLEDFNAAEWTRVVRKINIKRASRNRTVSWRGSVRRRPLFRFSDDQPRRSRSGCFQNCGPSRHKAVQMDKPGEFSKGPLQKPFCVQTNIRRVQIKQGLPEPIPRVFFVPPSSSRLEARKRVDMAARNPIPPRGGAPSNPPLHQPLPPRSTPVRVRDDMGAGGTGNTNSLGSNGQDDVRSRPP
jgi:hypothetical protein